jgi:Fic family protein
MRLIDTTYLDSYHNIIGNQIDSLAESFSFLEQNTELGYKTQASAVYSSNIEGNSIDLNSFMNYKLSQKAVKPHKEIQEIEQLILAYEYAQTNPLTEKNFLHCHKILAKTLLTKSKQGKYRSEKVGVFSDTGLVYLAIEPEYVKATMNELFQDIQSLLQQPLSRAEVFYFAALLHLKLAHIHPFMDGNGRSARLLEKWFLSAKLGAAYWKLPAEKYYKENQTAYYENINLGVNYYMLDYRKSLPFLAMLPNALK